MYEDVIEKKWKYLKKKKGVLSIREGYKFKNGKKTKIPCISVFVKKKIDKKLLSSRDLIPKKVEGIITDVVELSTKDFKLGETKVSKLPPSIQKKIASGVKK